MVKVLLIDRLQEQSILDAGILIMVQQVMSKIDDILLEHGEVPHVLPLAVHLRPLLHA